MEREFDAMPEPVRAAWRELWDTLGDLPWDDGEGEVRLPVATLARALAPLDLDDHPRWRDLRIALGGRERADDAVVRIPSLLGLVMAELAEIEAALAADFDREQLAVYGDYLQSIGDLRGELIAIDLHVAKHGRSPEREERKRELVMEWLGEELATIIAHVGAIDHGFVLLGHRAPDMAAFTLDELLVHPAGEFLRELTVLDDISKMIGLLDQLAQSPRRWLMRLRLIAPRSPDEAAALQQALVALPLLRQVDLVEVGGSYHVAFPSQVSVSRSSS